MSQENPRSGALRLHGELLKLGVEIAQSTVATYFARRRAPPSQGWKTFLRNHAPRIGAVDLLVVPTIGFKLLYGLVILRFERRQLVWTNVTANPTAERIARQITEAFPWDRAPRYLIRDRHSSYGTVLKRGLRAMGIRDRPITSRSPWVNGHAERLIGSIRRECLDYVVVLVETHLRRILATYAVYYSGSAHISRSGRTHPRAGPLSPSVASFRYLSWAAFITTTSGWHKWQRQGGQHRIFYAFHFQNIFSKFFEFDRMTKRKPL